MTNNNNKSTLQDLKLPAEGISPIIVQSLQTSRSLKLSLLVYAEQIYGLAPEESRQILKERGYEKMEAEKFLEMLSVLREHWSHIKELRAQEAQSEAARIAQLQELESTLVVKDDPDGWRWEGTEEALAAHWELEEIRREREFKRWNTWRRRRLTKLV